MAEEFRSSGCIRLRVHVVCKMAERKMFGRQLYERRKLAPANFFGAFASRRKRTARRQAREVRWLPGDLIKRSLLVRRIGNRAEQSAGVRIGWPFAQLLR